MSIFEQRKCNLLKATKTITPDFLVSLTVFMIIMRCLREVLFNLALVSHLISIGDSPTLGNVKLFYLDTYLAVQLDLESETHDDHYQL